MTRDSMRLMLSATLLALASCAPASRPDTSEADAQIMRGMAAEWIDYFNATNAEGLSSLYMDDMVNVGPDGPDVVGREALRARFAEEFEEFASTQSATVAEVEVVGDIAYTRGEWRTAQTPRAGGDQVEISGKWLWITKRQPDGQWKISRHIWNQDL